MANLADIAERAKDLYYQDYAPRTAFFNIEDFKFHASAQYSMMINAMYRKQRAENKAETSFSNVDINPQWLIREAFDKIDVVEATEEYSVTTKFPVFSFDFDAFANGLNEVRPYNRKCSLKKISTNELRFQDILPVTSDIYYHLEGSNKIIFLKNPKPPITAYYIPQVLASEDSSVIPDSIVPDIIKTVLDLMFGAKKGNVIQESNDGNENPTLQGQTNNTLLK